MKRSATKTEKIIIAILAVLVIFFAVGSGMLLSGKNGIYGGVRADGIALSGLTKEKAMQKLERELQEADFKKEITVVLDGIEKKITVSDFASGYDFEKTADTAFAVGRKGNFFADMFDAVGARLGLKNIKPDVKYSQTKLDKITKELMKGIGEPVEEYSYKFKDNSVLIHTGKSGNMPDEEKIQKEILDAVKNKKFGKKLVFKKETRHPKDIDAEELYKEIAGNVQDAKYAVEDGKVIVIPDKMGAEFDIKTAKKIIEKNKGENRTFEIPAKIIKPKVTAGALEGKIFTDTLSTYTTRYNSGVLGRSNNIGLAAKKINGKILLPGESFSYNNEVGERTADKGFETAKVYLDGESVDGIGGGICQVSSTLYSAVLYADLEVLERMNHQLTVSYVPLGQDATVDYGNIDFRFKNNTDYPIKLMVSGGGGNVSVSILGYKEDKTKKVIIENKTVSIVEPKEKIEKDPTLPLGERKIVSRGATGAVVETYKTVMSKGEKVYTKCITKSTYGGGKTVIKEGTGPAAVQEPEEPQESETTDVPVISPADIENPPEDTGI